MLFAPFYSPSWAPMLRSFLGCHVKSASRASLGEFVLRFVVRLDYSGSFWFVFCLFRFNLLPCDEFVPNLAYVLK